MYTDLADATEAYIEKGYTHTFELKGESIYCDSLDKNYSASDLEIVESYTHDEGTDPGSESTLYALRTKSGDKGLLIISYGMYADKDKAHLIDKLLEVNRD